LVETGVSVCGSVRLVEYVCVGDDTAGLVKDVQNLVVLPWAVRVSDGGLLTCFGQVMRGLKNVAQHFGGGGGA